MNKRYFLLLLYFISNVVNVFSQNPVIDSLLNEIKKRPGLNNSLTIDLMNSLSREYLMIGEFDKSLSYSNIVLSKAEQASGNWALKARAKAFNNIAIVSSEHGEVEKAFEYYGRASEIYGSLKDKKGLAAIYGNTGLLYLDKGDFAKALEFQFKSLKMEEELGNKQGIGDSYGNIGLVYHDKREFSKALEYQLKSVKIDEELGDKARIGISYNSLGNLYGEIGPLDKALDYYERAKELFEEIGDKEGVAGAYGNIGIVYQQQDKYPKAIDYHIKALSIFEEIGDMHGITETYRNLGVLYLRLNNPTESRKYFNKSLIIARELMSKNDMMVAYMGISDADSVLGDYQNAYKHHKLYTRLKDSLFNEEINKRTVQSEMNFEFEKKEQAARMDQEKKDALALEELKKQRMQRNAFIGGFALMLTLAGVSYKSYRSKRKSHALIEHQKELVEEKQKDILDSINYAKRIQQALLKEEDQISREIKNYFVLFKPKDIVSGDFYWSHCQSEYIYLAAVDCTGHGVPGAFMSMLGIAFLNEITSSASLQDTGDVLNNLREKVINNMRQTGKEGENKDGMDISLIRINTSNWSIQWSGANNPVWILNTETRAIDEIKGDKQPVGFSDFMKPFTTHEFTLKNEEQIYIFTDGYADQFGGEKGKKFKYSNLKNLLIDCSDKSMIEQKEILASSFESWKGGLEQVDDVCVIGFKK